MPGDVTPDLNGNFKRQSAAAAEQMAASNGGTTNEAHSPDEPSGGSYYYADPATLLGLGFGAAPMISASSGASSNAMSNPVTSDTSSSPSSYYYQVAPFIKFRDPKDDLDLGK